MKELLEKLHAALAKIEDRLGHYLEAKSAIPANAVVGNAVAPGLAEELSEAKAALAEIEKLAESGSVEEALVAANKKIDSYVKTCDDLTKELADAHEEIAELVKRVEAGRLAVEQMAEKLKSAEEKIAANSAAKSESIAESAKIDDHK